jgi:adenylylsulfate kinase-like enzyme
LEETEKTLSKHRAAGRQPPTMRDVGGATDRSSRWSCRLGCWREDPARSRRPDRRFSALGYSPNVAGGERIPTLLLTGTVGSGKTVVAAEIGRLLEEGGVSSAIVDLDWLGWVHLPRGSVSPDDLIIRNLTAIWANLRGTGIRHAVLARAVLRRNTVHALRLAVPEADLTVVRLTAPPEMIEDRLRRRDTGAILEGHLREFRTMAGAMEEARVEDLVVVNDGRPIQDIAANVLREVGWQ